MNRTMAAARPAVPRTEGADHDVVVVLDFGAQYAQLIARRVREHRVKSLILPYDVSVDTLRRLNPRGLILSGGPASVYARGAPRSDPELFRLGIPILGICYGMQLMAHVLGGETGPSDRREYGRTRLFINRHEPLFSGLESRLICWMSHGDAVTRLPEDFLALAHTDAGNVAAMGQPARGLYGVQFHPEVSHTPWGSEVLRAFLLTICGCRPTWTMRSFVDQAVDEVHDALPEGRAICALSGGVDSATAAALVHRAVGDRLRCIFVDHGLLREGEADEVVRVFRDAFGIPLVHVTAADRFLERLRNVTDPEVKRRLIGEEFVRVFEEEAAGLGMAAGTPDDRRDSQVEALVQGTLYPDVIESGTRTAARIKTHHNVGGLPADMRLRVIEPLRELFKDEVREVARTLGLPDSLVERHPFPGPGLAIRIAGEVTQERLARLRRADAIVREEVRRAGKHRELWQAFAVLLPVATVGVAGDARTYGDVVVVRAVTSQDGMTADWARLPDDLLETLASRITREVPGISRVLYDVTSKPPATIEWE